MVLEIDFETENFEHIDAKSAKVYRICKKRHNI